MMYNKKVMQHFLKPKNVGRIKNADAVGKIVNVRCGDIMEIYLKIGKKKIRTGKEKGKEKEIIKDIKFQTLGCPAAISTSDVLCELVKGKSIKEAEKIKDNEIVKKLGGLPFIKLHCSVLGVETLKKAIENFRIKKKQEEKKARVNNLIKKL